MPATDRTGPEPRVKSAIFVAALVRRALAAGLGCVVVRHGADEAGAIFVTIDRLDGTLDFYGPAPQTAVGDADRLFAPMRERTSAEDLDALLMKELRFDPDLWVVAIEDRQGRPFVTIAAG